MRDDHDELYIVPVGQQFVHYALGIGALELVPEGRTLKSGRLSPYFFNSGLFTSGQSHLELANAYVKTIMELFEGEEGFDTVFGPAYKGIGLAVSIAEKLVVHDQQNGKMSSVSWCYNRKEVKDHGEGGLLVGASLKGERVLIVDDVITDGTSKREAVDLIRASGGIPVGCVIAFDRMERGLDETDTRSARQRFQEDFGIRTVAVATLEDLISVLTIRHPAAPTLWREMLPKVQEYQDKYGCAR